MKNLKKSEKIAVAYMNFYDLFNFYPGDIYFLEGLILSSMSFLFWLMF